MCDMIFKRKEDNIVHLFKSLKIIDKQIKANIFESKIEINIMYLQVINDSTRRKFDQDTF